MCGTKNDNPVSRGGTGKKTNYIYMVRCRDGSLYTGWTTDLERRIRIHNEGKGARYTKSRLPVELVYFERFETSREARKRECAIKKMTRQEKLALISSARPPAGTS